MHKSKEKNHPMLHGHHEGKVKMGKKEPVGKQMGKHPDHYRKEIMKHIDGLHKMAKMNYKKAK